MTDYAIIQQGGVDTAVRMRLGLSALLPDIGSRRNRSGLFDDGGVVTLTSGMSVSVSAFRAFIQGTSGGNQGGYFCVRDAAANLTFGDGGGSNRTDIIVARIYDDDYDSSGETKFAVEIVQGTGGGGVPATPANAIKLAEKVITAGMSAGTGGLGTVPVDKRPPRLVAAGGIVPVLGPTDRATLAAYAGLTVYRIDEKIIQVYNGTSWETYAKSKRPAAFLYQDAGSPQSVANDTNQVIAMDNVDFDTDTMADTGNDRLNIVTPGVYDVRGIITWASAGTGYRETTILINGTTRFTNRVVAGSGFATAGVETGGLVELDQGDTVSLRGRHTQGTALATVPSVPGFVCLSAHLISTL